MPVSSAAECDNCCTLTAEGAVLISDVAYAEPGFLQDCVDSFHSVFEARMWALTHCYWHLCAVLFLCYLFLQDPHDKGFQVTSLIGILKAEQAIHALRLVSRSCGFMNHDAIL